MNLVGKAAKFGVRVKPRISIGVDWIQLQLAPVLQGQIADNRFETRGLVIKADPAQLSNEARPVARQRSSLAGDFLCHTNHHSSSAIIVLTFRSEPAGGEP
jgi:hypothetical protein